MLIVDSPFDVQFFEDQFEAKNRFDKYNQKNNNYFSLYLFDTLCFFT